MSELLQRAIDNLEIQDVFQKSLNAFCAPDFDPKFDDLENVEINFLHLVRRSEMFEMVNGDEKKKIFRVHILLGARWAAKNKENQDSDDIDELAKIEGRLIAEYLVKDDIPQESLKEFAMRNASYHVWPYWREIVAGQCVKMHLPVITMPVMQFPLRTDEETNPEG